MKIRDALESDLPAIVEIYNASIPGQMATADLEPVSVESRLAWFREFTPTRRPLWVMEDEQRVVGWLSLRSFYGRPAYHVTVELGLYVAPDYQRRGVGRQLVSHAIAQSPALGISTLLGFVFAHNEPSLRLLESFGFARWGYLPNVAELDGIQRSLIILGYQSTGSATGRDRIAL